jgi:hypothetical protein
MSYVYIVLAMCMVCTKKKHNKQMNYFDCKKLTTKTTNKKIFKIRAKLGSPGRERGRDGGR